MEALIELNNVSKSFGEKQVLKNVKFCIPQGEIIGLIGPNGSGKTTIINIILGIIKQTQGQLKIKEGLKIGSCVLTMGIFPEFSVSRNLSIAQTILGASITQRNNIIEAFNLNEILSVRFSKLSTGMKQIVALSISFMGDPDLVILDEPLNGLDVDHIIFFRNFIETQKGKRTIFIASHILSELEKTCTHVVFIKGGTIIRNGSKDSILNEFGSFEAAYLN
ncbi:MAG: ABC transporter ATP-binding protein [Cytophagales bacterium]|nr:ABC transporter ATP-binding protein [Cytophagales bacterium]